ncbi:hypothetical protein K2W90_00620 [Candidatus Babeliales bacterium]|nr:hypothetical protein [Candidatus Babeliales bacterium]
MNKRYAVCAFLLLLPHSLQATELDDLASGLQALKSKLAQLGQALGSLAVPIATSLPIPPPPVAPPLPIITSPSPKLTTTKKASSPSTTSQPKADLMTELQKRLASIKHEPITPLTLPPSTPPSTGTPPPLTPRLQFASSSTGKSTLSSPDLLAALQTGRSLRTTGGPAKRATPQTTQHLAAIRSGKTLRATQSAIVLPSVDPEDIEQEIVGLLMDSLNKITKKNDLKQFVYHFTTKLKNISDDATKIAIIKQAWKKFLDRFLSAQNFAKKFEPILTDPADKFMTAMVYLGLDLFILEADQASIDAFNQEFKDINGTEQIYPLFQERFNAKAQALNVDRAKAQELSKLTTFIGLKQDDRRLLNKEELLYLANIWQKNNQLFKLLLIDPTRNQSTVTSGTKRKITSETIEDNKFLIRERIAKTLNTRVRKNQIEFDEEEKKIMRALCIGLQLQNHLEDDFGKKRIAMPKTITFLRDITSESQSKLKKVPRPKQEVGATEQKLKRLLDDTSEEEDDEDDIKDWEEEEKQLPKPPATPEPESDSDDDDEWSEEEEEEDNK